MYLQKAGLNIKNNHSIPLAAAAFHIVFFFNLDNLKKHLLQLFEIELFAHFSPPFANTFSVIRYYFHIVRKKNDICLKLIFIKKCKLQLTI